MGEYGRGGANISAAAATAAVRVMMTVGLRRCQWHVTVRWTRDRETIKATNTGSATGGWMR